VSAKTKEGIDGLFHKLANLCYEEKDNFNLTEVRGTFKLNRDATVGTIEPKKKDGCC